MIGVPRALGLFCIGALVVTAMETARADISRACVDAINAVERRAEIPPGLLHAIGRLESGKWDKDRQRVVPWPWTINAEGSGQYFDTKNQAIAAVQALLDRGVKLVDVGCMQVNLHYHGQAFESLDDALDPHRNAEYAAQLLNSLYEETGSWNLAAGRYHSATPQFNVPYRERVMAAWRQGRGLDSLDGALPGEDTRDGDNRGEGLASDEPRKRVAFVPIDSERMQKILLIGQRRLHASRLKNRTSSRGDTLLRGARRTFPEGSKALAAGNRSPGAIVERLRRDPLKEQAFAKRRAQVLERWRSSRVRSGGQGPVFILDDES